MQKIIERLNQKSQLLPILMIGAGILLLVATAYLFVTSISPSEWQTNEYYSFVNEYQKHLVFGIIAAGIFGFVLFIIFRQHLITKASRSNSEKKTDKTKSLEIGIGFKLFPYFLVIALCGSASFIVPSILRNLKLLFTAPGYDRPYDNQPAYGSQTIPNTNSASKNTNKNRKQGR